MKVYHILVIAFFVKEFNCFSKIHRYSRKHVPVLTGVSFLESPLAYGANGQYPLTRGNYPTQPLEQNQNLYYPPDYTKAYNTQPYYNEHYNNLGRQQVPQTANNYNINKPVVPSPVLSGLSPRNNAFSDSRGNPFESSSLKKIVVGAGAADGAVVGARLAPSTVGVFPGSVGPAILGAMGGAIYGASMAKLQLNLGKPSPYNVAVREANRVAEKKANSSFWTIFYVVLALAVVAVFVVISSVVFSGKSEVFLEDLAEPKNNLVSNLKIESHV